jgi:FkbH-like protein
MRLKSFTELKRNLKSAPPGRGVRLALLGDGTNEFLGQALRGDAIGTGFDYDLYLAAFDQVESEILDPASGLYGADPELVVVAHTTARLLERFYFVPAGERARFAERYVASVEELAARLASRSAARLLWCTLPEWDDGVFGSYASRVPTSFLYQLRSLNLGLMAASQRAGNLYIADVARLQAERGRRGLFDPRTWHLARMPFAVEALPAVARCINAVVRALRGAIVKCVVLDLDGTLWGGLVGEDGVGGIEMGPTATGQAYRDLQFWLRELRGRGVLLAVCSANDEEVARQAFRAHPDAVLRLEDFAVFVANWEPKAGNLRFIQSVLEVGFDSMVFLDDSPFEREMVRNQLPGVLVPELPEDASERLDYLRALDLFETASVSAADAERTGQYQAEAERRRQQETTLNLAAFLEGLDLRAACAPVDALSASRVAQLTQRTNQFNLRGVRYTEDEMRGLVASSRHLTLGSRLRDRLGDYGLVSAVVLRRDDDGLFVDTWVMSCRALRRGVEEHVLNEMIGLARRAGCARLVGEYLPGPRNGLVKDLYSRLGFRAREDGCWVLELDGQEPLDTAVKPQNPREASTVCACRFAGE